MRRLVKKVLIIVIMILLTMIILIGESNASLQANPNTHYQKRDYVASWVKGIRYMEKSGEAMGLNETFNEDLTSESESNNIDVHLMRSTEYGAIAILSASGYGNPQTLQQSAIKTTTGNNTGIYFSGTNWEWVAGVTEGSNWPGIIADKRYYDSYRPYDITSAKIGDAVGNSATPNPGCAGWHNSSYSDWGYGSLPYWQRDGGGLFSFGFNYNTTSGPGAIAWARGVAVCGEGL